MAAHSVNGNVQLSTSGTNNNSNSALNVMGNITNFANLEIRSTLAVGRDVINLGSIEGATFTVMGTVTSIGDITVGGASLVNSGNITLITASMVSGIIRNSGSIIEVTGMNPMASSDIKVYGISDNDGSPCKQTKYKKYDDDEASGDGILIPTTSGEYNFDNSHISCRSLVPHDPVEILGGDILAD